MNYLILYWVLVGVMGVGVIGALIPGFPGTSIILTAILVWGVATNFTGITWPILIVFAILILSAGVEYLAAYIGGQQAGASKWAQFGAIIGLTIGFIGLLPALPLGGPLFGVLAGACIGAFIGEFLYQREMNLGERLQQSAKASLGIVIGSIIGNVIEALLAIIAVVIFVLTTWPLVAGLQG